MATFLMVILSPRNGLLQTGRGARRSDPCADAVRRAMPASALLGQIYVENLLGGEFQTINH